MPTGEKDKPYHRGDHDRTPMDDRMDMRDAMSSIIGKGYKGMTDETIRGLYSYLISNKGQGVAQKLMNHMLLFNQREDVQGKPWQDRLTTFYSMGAGDKELNDIIKDAGGLGYGPVDGVRTSHMVSARTGVAGISMTDETMANAQGVKQ